MKTLGEMLGSAPRFYSVDTVAMNSRGAQSLKDQTICKVPVWSGTLQVRHNIGSRHQGDESGELVLLYVTKHSHTPRGWGEPSKGNQAYQLQEKEKII